jgi:hypothetical protein
MRWKIILVNGGIVMVLSLLSFFLVRSSLGAAASNPSEQRRELGRALQAANAQLSVDALRLERWIAQKAAGTSLASVYSAGTASARSDAATAEANRLRDSAVAEAEFAKMSPSLVLMVDAEGVGVGRNGSQLMRGDTVGAAYPDLVAALKAGTAGSALWVNKQRQEQLLVAYAPVRDTAGAVLGAVILGVPLNDDSLNRTSELTSGKSLALTIGEAGSIATSGGGLSVADAKAAVAGALAGNLSFATSASGETIFAALPLSGFGSSSAVLVGAIPSSTIPNLDALLWPLFAVGGLGLLLVVIGGVLLGAYISKPVAEIEEGLLLIMNGQQDLRFDLEHEELGGLTSRINGLLNTILGVPEEASSPEN